MKNFVAQICCGLILVVSFSFLFSLHILILILFLKIKTFARVTEAADCRDDYSPCTCSQTSGGVVYIDCIMVPLNEIQSAFNRSAHLPYFYELALTPPANEPVIPADILSGKTVEVIKLSCPSDTYPLRVYKWRMLIISFFI